MTLPELTPLQAPVVPAVVLEPGGDRIAHARQVLHSVPDPEVPAVSLYDLGIVRDVRLLENGVLDVVLTPTYSGCPATEVIESDVLAAISAAGLGPAQVTLQRAPAWTTDWISAEGREKLRAYGIAPPGPVDVSQGVPVRFMPRRAALSVPCPHCASTHTERLSAFGATACKALHRCLDCREPFEHFKPI